MASEERNIVILGASYAGLQAAHHLLKYTVPTLNNPSTSSSSSSSGTKTTYKVVIVSPTNRFFNRPAAPRAMLSDAAFDQDQLFIDIPSKLSVYPSAHWRLVQAVATGIDPETRRVTVRHVEDASKEGEHEDEETSDIPYHALLVATGANTVSPLLSTNSQPHSGIRSAWSTLREALPAAKTIIIAGGGPSGVETAGELASWYDEQPAPVKKPSIILATASNELIPLLRPSLQKKAKGVLEKLGIRMVMGVRVTETSPPNAGTTEAGIASLTKVTMSNGETVEADIYIPATGLTPNSSFLPASWLDSKKRVNTNSSTLRVEGQKLVYALGDVSNAARQVIPSINFSVPTLGANMKRDLLLDAGLSDASVPKEKEYKEDLRETHLVVIGKAKGVGAVMGWAVPSWFVWFLKGKDYGASLFIPPVVSGKNAKE